jgi:hypothetical protein
MKTCVISLGVDVTRRNCQRGLDRLERSLKRVGFKGDILFWRDSYPDDCPSHLESPFAFKAFCFMEAKERGYDLILWADSSIVAIRPIQVLFKKIEQEGYLIFRNSKNILGHWCSDEALKILNLSRDDALKIQEVVGATIGLNMKNSVAIEFLNQWYESACDGISFRGVKEALHTKHDYNAVKWNVNNRISSDPRVKGHRHDQTVAGVIANRLGMKISNEGLSQENYGLAHKNNSAVLLVKRDSRISLNRILVEVKAYPLLTFLRRVK